MTELGQWHQLQVTIVGEPICFLSVSIHWLMVMFNCSYSANPISLNLDRFVRRDRHSPMRKNTFVSPNAILSARRTLLRHTIPTSAYWLVTHVVGVAYKNLSANSDFSQMRLSRSGFDSECGAFRAGLILNEFKTDRIHQMFESEHYMRVAIK